jgi:hypothetical protein
MLMQLMLTSGTCRERVDTKPGAASKQSRGAHVCLGAVIEINTNDICSEATVRRWDSVQQLWHPGLYAYKALGPGNLGAFRHRLSSYVVPSLLSTSPVKTHGPVLLPCFSVYTCGTCHAVLSQSLPAQACITCPIILGADCKGCEAAQQVVTEYMECDLGSVCNCWRL